MQNRDCQLRGQLPKPWCVFINTFILNSPSTLRCPITAQTLTAQNNLVPKSNANQIQNQEVSHSSFPLPAFSPWSPHPCHQGTQQRSSVQFTFNAMTQKHKISHLFVQLPKPVSRLSVKAATHTLPLSSSPWAMLRTPVHWGQWTFSLGLKKSPSPQWRRWEKQPAWRDTHQHGLFSS